MKYPLSRLHRLPPQGGRRPDCRATLALRPWPGPCSSHRPWVVGSSVVH